MNDCSPQVRHCFLNPQNVGDVVDATTIGRVGSYICGATMRVSLRIDEQQRITDARFKAAGCVVLIAAASQLTSLIQGKTTAEAAALAYADSELLDCLGNPAPNREHCAALACQSVISAITSFSNATRDQWVGEQALICTCFCVSEGVIENAIRQHKLRTIAEVTNACRAGAGCRSCYSLIEDILASQRHAVD